MTDRGASERARWTSKERASEDEKASDYRPGGLAHGHAVRCHQAEVHVVMGPVRNTFFAMQSELKRLPYHELAMKLVHRGMGRLARQKLLEYKKVTTSNTYASFDTGDFGRA